MAFVVYVRDEVRDKLPAITHVDGSARIQTVSQSTNPRFHALISEFERLTGVPVLLNTSFNNDAEPIVNDLQDAVTCFLTSGLHYLIAGDYVVEKKVWGLTELSTLVAEVAPDAVLLKEQCSGEAGQQETARRIVWNFDQNRVLVLSKKDRPITDETYGVLCALGNDRTLGEVFTITRVTEQAQQRLAEDLVSLWTERFIRMRPLAR